MKTRGRKKRRAERNALVNKSKRISIWGVEPLKAAKPNRNTLFANAKREKKDGKFIFTKHVVKGNNYFIGMYQREVRDNMFDKELEGRVSIRRERSKETSKTSFHFRSIKR